MMHIQFPTSLKKGDKIAVVSPAGSVEDSSLTKTLDLIRSNGFDPVLSEHCLGKYSEGYSYSGTEKERIQDMNHALNDAGISAVWASRGGYGCQHLLRHLRLSSFRQQPRWYIGYSDNTVIQSFLLRNGFASIHGQTVKTSSFGVSLESYQGIFDILKGKKPVYTTEKNLFNRYGIAKGQLVGGNLALVYALLGTPYSFQFKDKILFIEEIGENFYALDRMLMSLDLAGVFRKIKGLIVGGMTNMGSEKDNKEYDSSFDTFAYEIISNRIRKYDFPAVFGFPNGHIFENLPLIIGADVEINSGENPEIKFY